MKIDENLFSSTLKRNEKKLLIYFFVGYFLIFSVFYYAFLYFLNNIWKTDNHIKFYWSDFVQLMILIAGLVYSRIFLFKKYETTYSYLIDLTNALTLQNVSSFFFVVYPLLFIFCFNFMTFQIVNFYRE